MILVFQVLYNRRRKEKNYMSKKRNELNGVLVYRRWCAGAIVSAILVLAMVGVVVATICLQWIGITATGVKYTLTGLDTLIPLIDGTTPAFTDFVNANAGGSSIPVLSYIYQYGLYGILGLLGIIAIFGVVELIFFFLYLFTGRVASPSGPVRIAWVIFVLTLIYGGLGIGLLFLVSDAYYGTTGLGSNIDFIYPIIYSASALVVAILLSIVYTVAFKDKFFIGRAKRFGSGEVTQVETTHIITPPVTTSTQGNQPQVIVVNSNPGTQAAAPLYAPMAVPQVQQPVVVTGREAPVATKREVETPVVPAGVLPMDTKSIGGHAFARNLDLKFADIPNGIKELGIGAFANCLNLEVVSLPKSVKRIRKNCFFNCVKLGRINYEGTKSDWRYIVRGSNWLEKAGTRTVVCSDGAIIVDPRR